MTPSTSSDAEKAFREALEEWRDKGLTEAEIIDRTVRLFSAHVQAQEEADADNMRRWSADLATITKLEEALSQAKARIEELEREAADLKAEVERLKEEKLRCQRTSGDWGSGPTCGKPHPCPDHHNEFSNILAAKNELLAAAIGESRDLRSRIAVLEEENKARR